MINGHISIQPLKGRNMDLDKLQQEIESKVFVNGGFTYRFVSGNTIQINGSPTGRYSFYREDDSLFLKHDNTLGVNEDVKIDLVKIVPLTIQLQAKSGGRPPFVWVEKENHW